MHCSHPTKHMFFMKSWRLRPGFLTALPEALIVPLGIHLGTKGTFQVKSWHKSAACCSGHINANAFMRCHPFIQVLPSWQERKGEGSWRKGEVPCKIHFRSWVSCSSTRCLLNQQDTASQFCIVLRLHLNLGEDSSAQDFQGCKSKRVKDSLTHNGLVNIVIYRTNCTSSSATEHTSSSVIAHWETVFPALTRE